MDIHKRNPAYARISDEIAAEIASGALLESDQLPTERDMCEKYGVSRITVRHALSLLEQNGLIRKRQGQGIFVCPRRYEQDIGSLYSFDQTFERIGARHRREVISLEQRSVSGEIAAKLGLFDRSMCCIITCLCSVEEKPYAYEISHVPPQLMAGATAQSIERVGIYEQIRQSCGMVREQAIERFEAVLAPTDLLNVLDRRGPLVLMKLERLSLSEHRPIEFMTSYLVGDKIGFQLTVG